MGLPTINIHHDRRRISMEWDVEDAIEIGYVLQSAGIGAKGVIKDQGFYDDGTALIEAGVRYKEVNERD